MGLKVAKKFEKGKRLANSKKRGSRLSNVKGDGRTNFTGVSRGRGVRRHFQAFQDVKKITNCAPGNFLRILLCIPSEIVISKKNPPRFHPVISRDI